LDSINTYICYVIRRFDFSQYNVLSNIKDYDSADKEIHNSVKIDIES